MRSQTECVLAAGIVDDVLDRDERAPFGQRIVRLSNELQLLLGIPVVEDVAHRDDVRLWQRIDEEVPRDDVDAVSKTGTVDFVLCVNSHRRKIERLTLKRRMPRRDHARQQSERPTDVGGTLLDQKRGSS